MDKGALCAAVQKQQWNVGGGNFIGVRLKAAKLTGYAGNIEK